MKKTMIGKLLHGFTLIEMLVVIAIIGILAAMLAPSLHKALDAAKAISCANNMKQCGIATLTFSQDHDGWLVPTDGKPTKLTEMGRPGWQWSSILLMTGYINEKVLRADYYTINSEQFMIGGELSNNSVFLCPSMVGGLHKFSSTSSTNGFSTLTTFAMQISGRNHCSGNAKRKHWFDLDGNPPGSPSTTDTRNINWFGRHTKVNWWATDVPFFGDAVTSGSGQSFNTGQGPLQWNGWTVEHYPGPAQNFHRRHNDRTNAWFLDNHIKSMNLDDICALSDYSITSFDKDLNPFP